MLYVIIGRDVPHSLEKRRAARPAHVDRLKALLAEGRIAIAGPMPAIDSPDPGPAGYSGSVIIAEFPSLAAARASYSPSLTERARAFTTSSRCRCSSLARSMAFRPVKQPILPYSLFFSARPA